jgi:hypothetical protein
MDFTYLEREQGETNGVKSEEERKREENKRQPRAQPTEEGQTAFGTRIRMMMRW